MIGHLLNTRLTVQRTTLVSDGMGGSVEQTVDVAAVAAKVDQSTASEREAAAQSGSKHSHNVYLMPSADVRRGDVLRDATRRFRVLATVTPSRPVYLKAECEAVQPEGA